MLLVITSCVSEEEPVEVPVSDIQQAVEDAKAWFGPQEEFGVPVSAGANAKAKARTKKIQWNKSITHENGRVIEVAVKYSAHAVPMRDDTTRVAIKEKQKSSFYRLLIRKDSMGNYSKSLLKFFPETSIEGQSQLEVNNFMSLSSQFSGDIQLTDWDENLETGWLIANGNVVEQYYEKKHGIKEKSYANAVVECRNVEKEVCTYYYEDNPLYEEGIGWEEQNVVECYFYIVPECSEIDEEG
ncbi:hypothetical protein, partial [Algoriphagus persicinus]|uniref:hypothetical protein n=1 Tax=Algoriphagus persicinus TaxID=3108754 RepID=UPI002B3CDCE8